MALNPYVKSYASRPAGGNPRETEGWALTEAARRIRVGQSSDPFDSARFLDAVRLNWRLWTVFQAEISGPDCTLPADIRSNMLSLCNFVDKTTVALILDPQPAKADILITINREIAAGLLSTPNGQPEAPPPEAMARIDGSF